MSRVYRLVDSTICLICGNVGCGRYAGGHAKEHWRETAHSFSLELETQHVWDYAGDTWAHRLIRDKGDGKVVELPSAAGRHHHHHHHHHPGNDGGGGGGGDDDDEDWVPRSKLDNIGLEYTHLLTSQLESQRVYFEEMVAKAADKAAAAATAAEQATEAAGRAERELGEARAEAGRLRDEAVPALEKEGAREKARAERSAELARSLGRSLREERAVAIWRTATDDGVNRSDSVGSWLRR